MKKIVFGVSMFVSVQLFSQQDEIYAKETIAVNGYDVVAYFTEAKPVKGTATNNVTYKGVNWQFSSKENAELFRTNPERYEPQYGGYCAFGCSRGYKAETSPEAWTIVEGKLYLNYNKEVRDTWNKDQQAYIKKADANWLSIKFKKYN
ncbi:MAG TPA: YHS domain-containing (seleno)protein [Chitinophagaceae bacterium]|nr:YHS domain-containing (seleno)protein [Chitinophagaceae bacterium]